MKFQRRVVFVDAVQFDPAKKPWPEGVDAQPCYCPDLAQDGRRCELHKEKGRRYGLVRIGELGEAHRRVEIERGEWLVDHGPDLYGIHRYSVYKNDEFNALYEPAP